MAGPTILIVDDEIDDLQFFSATLEKAEFRVITALNGQEALRILYKRRPELILLDLELRDKTMDGYEVCKRIREISTVPIIVLTRQDMPENAIRALELGADDFVSKKDSETGVLVARVNATIRRAAAEPSYEKVGVVYRDGFLTVNVDERRVLKRGNAVKLTPTEFKLLIELIEAAPGIVPYHKLLENVWGSEYTDDMEYLRVYIWHLRQKLEPNPKEPIYIVNEAGIGYRFEKQSP